MKKFSKLAILTVLLVFFDQWTRLHDYARMNGGAVENCHIHHTGKIDHKGDAVFLEGYGMKVRHCLIHDIPGWAVYHMGAFHEIADNRIHDVVSRDYGAWGIYLDEGSSYVTVEGNAVFNTQTECLHIHYGSGNVIKNNVFYGKNAPCVYVSKHELHDQILFERNIFVTDGSPIYAQRDGAPDLESRYNLLWSIKSGEPLAFRYKNGSTLSIDEWQSVMGRDRGSIVADPLIADLDIADFTIAPTSPAFDLGFKALRGKTAIQ